MYACPDVPAEANAALQQHSSSAVAWAWGFGFGFVAQMLDNLIKNRKQHIIGTTLYPRKLECDKCVFLLINTDTCSIAFPRMGSCGVNEKDRAEQTVVGNLLFQLTKE